MKKIFTLSILLSFNLHAQDESLFDLQTKVAKALNISRVSCNSISESECKRGLNKLLKSGLNLSPIDFGLLSPVIGRYDYDLDVNGLVEVDFKSDIKTIRNFFIHQIFKFQQYQRFVQKNLNRLNFQGTLVNCESSDFRFETCKDFLKMMTSTNVNLENLGNIELYFADNNSYVPQKHLILDLNINHEELNQYLKAITKQ